MARWLHDDRLGNRNTDSRWDELERYTRTRQCLPNGKITPIVVRAQYSLPDRTNDTNTMGLFGTISRTETQCKQVCLLKVVHEASNPVRIQFILKVGKMVNNVIGALYMQYRFLPHECSVYPLMSAVQLTLITLTLK